MDQNFITWLIGQAGVGGLAGLALFLLDRSYRDALRREKETIETGREDRRQLIAVLNENAKTFTALQLAIESMTREVSRTRKHPGEPGDD